MKKYFPGEPILMNHWDGRKMVIVPFLSDDEFYVTDEVDKVIDTIEEIVKTYCDSDMAQEDISRELKKLREE